MQADRIAQRCLEKMKLLLRCLGGLHFHPNRHDRMFGPEGFQMHLKEAEQNLHRAGWIGNVKTMLVARLVAEGEAQPDFLCDEIERAEAQGELLKKTPQDKKERLGRLDLVLELDFFDENFRWPNESQKPCRPAVRLFPELDRNWTEPRPELIGLERGKLAQGVDAPLVEDGDDARNLRGALRACGGSTFHAPD